MTRGKARTPRTVRKLNIGGGGGSSQPPTGLPSFAKSTLEAYVKASNTGTGDGFGSSVAVDGNTLVVGAPSEDSNATGINGNQANNSASGSGAVYVFTRSNGVWTQQAYLKASNTGVQDHFGTSVALSGETLAVGAPDEDSNAMGINGNQSDNSAENSGAVYIFTRVNGEWHQQAYVKLSKPPGVLDPIEMDWMAKHWRFGASVALSGEILAVGAPGAELLSEENGAVYVFKRAITMVGGQPGVKWKQQAFVGSPLQGIGYSFGYSVALGGETLAAGDHSTNKQVHQCGLFMFSLPPTEHGPRGALSSPRILAKVISLGTQWRSAARLWPWGLSGRTVAPQASRAINRITVLRIVGPSMCLHAAGQPLY
jgi:hypothetical protein